MDRRQETTERGSDSQNDRVVPAAFTIPEFCAAHRISRALFYILAREGRAPAIIKAGRRTLVSVEAAANWRRAMEASSGGSEK